MAIARDPKGRLKFLKGESKSRARLTSTVVKEAADALDRDYGRPTRHTVLYIAERLREYGEDELALDLETAVLHSFSRNSVDHLLFTVSSNNPDRPLHDHLSRCTNKSRLACSRDCIFEHGKFVNRLFSEL